MLQLVRGALMIQGATIRVGGGATGTAGGRMEAADTNVSEPQHREFMHPIHSIMAEIIQPMPTTLDILEN